MKVMITGRGLDGETISEEVELRDETPAERAAWALVDALGAKLGRGAYHTRRRAEKARRRYRRAIMATPDAPLYVSAHRFVSGGGMVLEAPPDPGAASLAIGFSSALVGATFPADGVEREALLSGPRRIFFTTAGSGSP